MSKFADKKKGYESQALNAEFLPTKADYDKLRAGMKEFKRTRVGTEIYDEFRQYMVKLGVISFSAKGVAVKNPAEYSKYLTMYSNIQAKDDAELKHILDTVPGEREAYNERLSTIFAQMKEMLKKTHARFKAT